jgi:glutathione S-transferase
MLTLYRDSFWISPYVYSCWVALEEKRLGYDVVEISLGAGAQRDPAYADATVTGRVPALRHGDFVLAESSAIVEYLDEAFPDRPPMLPRDLRARARCRQLMSWIRSDDTMPIRAERSTATMFYERASTPLSEAARKAVDKLFRVAERVIPDGADSLFGAFSIADADLAFLLQRLILNGDPVPERLRAWADALWRRPTIAAFVELPRKPFEPY